MPAAKLGLDPSLAPSNPPPYRLPLSSRLAGGKSTGSVWDVSWKGQRAYPRFGRMFPVACDITLFNIVGNKLPPEL